MSVDALHPAFPAIRFRSTVLSAKISDRYSLHSLRHTAATWMIAGGMEIPAVQKVLGHSQSSTTSNIYAHVVEGRAESAVAAIADRVKALRSA